jgi:prolyl-tRNA editing enzyme YbaK/EbsC (Cys-tRNA(Pro) deacylase)
MPHPNSERVQTALKALGLECEVLELPDKTGTSAEAAAALGVTVSEIAKSLVFQSQENTILVIASGSNRVSMEKLEALAGSAVRRPSAGTVKERTGFPIGGIPPLGHATKLQTFVDQDLLNFSAVWAAAGTPRSVFRCTPDELVKMTDGSVSDLKEG